MHGCARLSSSGHLLKGYKGDRNGTREFALGRRKLLPLSVLRVRCSELRPELQGEHADAVDLIGQARIVVGRRVLRQIPRTEVHLLEKLVQGFDETDGVL